MLAILFIFEKNTKDVKVGNNILGQILLQI